MKLRYSMLLAGGIALAGTPALADNTVNTQSQHTKQTASTSAKKRLESPTGADSKSMTGTAGSPDPETASTDAELRQKSPTGKDSESMTRTTDDAAQGTGTSDTNASTSAKARQELDAGGVDSVNSDISTMSKPEKGEHETNEDADSSK